MQVTLVVRWSSKFLQSCFRATCTAAAGASYPCSSLPYGLLWNLSQESGDRRKEEPGCQDLPSLHMEPRRQKSSAKYVALAVLQSIAKATGITSRQCIVMTLDTCVSGSGCQAGPRARTHWTGEQGADAEGAGAGLASECKPGRRLWKHAQ